MRRLPFSLPLGATFYTLMAISFCGSHLETLSASLASHRRSQIRLHAGLHHGHTHHGCPAPGLCLQDTKLSFVNLALVPPLHCLHPKWLLEVKPQTFCSDSSTICEPPSTAQGSTPCPGGRGRNPHSPALAHTCPFALFYSVSYLVNSDPSFKSQFKFASSGGE